MRSLETHNYTAQTLHFCDRCCRDIEPGDYYERSVYMYKKDGKKKILVLRKHIEPHCDYPPEPEMYGTIFIEISLKKAA